MESETDENTVASENENQKLKKMHKQLVSCN